VGNIHAHPDEGQRTCFGHHDGVAPGGGPLRAFQVMSCGGRKSRLSLQAAQALLARCGSVRKVAACISWCPVMLNGSLRLSRNAGPTAGTTVASSQRAICRVVARFSPPKFSNAPRIAQAVRGSIPWSRPYALVGWPTRSLEADL
jgi:hypothetical protein